MNDFLRLDTKNLEGFVSKDDLEAILPEVEKAHNMLTEKSGQGNDFLGWTGLPVNMDTQVLEDIEQTSAKMRDTSDVIIIIGIGGSYLGSKASIEMLTDEFSGKKVFFAGYGLDGTALNGLLKMAENKDVSVNVISKSGTTTEPAVAFRIIFDFLKKKYSKEELKDRVICTTDKEKGALRSLADTSGFKTFVIPDDVGGRFSVLTPVGLLPAACAGIDIRNMLEGASVCRDRVSACDLDKNICYRYAAMRSLLYRKGKVIEVFSNFDKRFHYVAEWWKQLFGESEGKGGSGIFPASCDFTTDLHSMGQMIQDGARNMFETFLIDEEEKTDCVLSEVDNDLDDLNYLSGKDVSYINEQAYLATSEAHFEGGVPNSTIFMPNKNAFFLGQLFYFFETAVAISAYMLDVNPFNQPGVEAYKKKMFKLLGKPGA